MTRSLATQFFDLLSPRHCIGCNRRLGVEELIACSHCMLHAQFTPFYHHPYDNMMARMFWGIVDIERAAAFCYYETGSELAMLIHSIKYYGKEELAEDMGAMFARELSIAHFFEDIDVIVPVPLSEDRRKQRGYNQSECIATGMARISRLPVCNTVLERINFKGSQTKLNAQQRKENVEEAFRLLDSTGIMGKHVLLVDDVMTTGATLCACGKLLTGVEGVKVSIATLGFTRN